MAVKLRVPAELRREFADFRDDFDAVWAAWVAAGEETEQSRAAARAQAAQWINQACELPDAVEKLRGMFGYWSDLRRRVAPMGAREVAVVPGLSEREVEAMRERRAV